MILALAEIARAEQLLCRNHVRALARGLFDARQAFVQILARIVADAYVNHRRICFILVALVTFYLAILSLFAPPRLATLHFSRQIRFIKFRSSTMDNEVFL